MTSEPSVCAIVVAYHPDEGFAARLDDLLLQVSALVVVDNTPSDARRESIHLSFADDKKLMLIENHENLGVGAALNQGLEQAAAWSCDWLLTMDQDSRCHADMVQNLLQVMTNCVPTPKVIGSNYFDPRNGTTKIPTNRPGEFLDQKTVITSGSLVNVRFAKAIGGFRADYFIDQLDHEFCLRVRANGGRVVITSKPVMDHCVGEDGGVWLPLLGYLPNHAPLRKYYLARNSLVTIARYWRTEPDWCLRRALRFVLGLPLMALLERQRLAKMRAFLAGILDSVGGRMGPCRRVWLSGSVR